MSWRWHNVRAIRHPVDVTARMIHADGESGTYFVNSPPQPAAALSVNRAAVTHPQSTPGNANTNNCLNENVNDFCGFVFLNV